MLTIHYHLFQNVAKFICSIKTSRKFLCTGEKLSFWRIIVKCNTWFFFLTITYITLEQVFFGCTVSTTINY